MVSITLVLALVVLGAVVYLVGYDQSKEVGRRLASNTFTVLGAGFMGGLAAGDFLLQTAFAEPFATIGVLAGVAAWLGIEGMLAGVSGLQVFLVIVAAILVVMALGGGD